MPPKRTRTPTSRSVQGGDRTRRRTTSGAAAAVVPTNTPVIPSATQPEGAAQPTPRRPTRQRTTRTEINSTPTLRLAASTLPAALDPTSQPQHTPVPLQVPALNAPPMPIVLVPPPVTGQTLHTPLDMAAVLQEAVAKMAATMEAARIQSREEDRREMEQRLAQQRLYVDTYVSTLHNEDTGRRPPTFTNPSDSRHQGSSSSSSHDTQSYDTHTEEQQPHPADR